MQMQLQQQQQQQLQYHYQYQQQQQHQQQHFIRQTTNMHAVNEDWRESSSFYSNSALAYGLSSSMLFRLRISVEFLLGN